MKAKTTLPALPTGIVAADLVRPSWKLRKNSPQRQATVDYSPVEFELWHTTGFGWCIPTLHIRNASRRHYATRVEPRTYAARVDDGATVRIGLGPHVDARVTVYVKVNRLAALQKFLDLQIAGAVSANTIRDRISSRRAQHDIRRSDSAARWRGPRW